jgi:predicted metal-dependent hydrolase
VPAVDFARGIALFNEGHFFEAHEVLEDVWRAAPTEQKKFLQGLVQLAVAFHHHSTGNLVGMRSVMQRGMNNLAGETDDPYGVNVAPLIRSLTEWRKAIDNGQPLPAPKIELHT